MNGKHKTDKHKDNSRTRQTGKSTNTKTKIILQQEDKGFSVTFGGYKTKIQLGNTKPSKKYRRVQLGFFKPNYVGPYWVTGLSFYYRYTGNRKNH